MGQEVIPVKYELKNKITGSALVGNCRFIDGKFETTILGEQTMLDDVKHVKRIKTKKKVTDGGA